MRTHLDALPEGLKQVLDAISITALLGTLFDALPTISLILTVVWMVLRVEAALEERADRRRKRKEPAE